ncbi:hypothetical protein [Sporosarcina sp. BP05]|uniref:hypothetical protein n=1 Tax=Sporosarcina sp. BP05 TaxID=2758726 RepID=UPI001645FF86|nr:hypothetical protein [Sporosarcina sp. BP05]
MDRKVDIHSFKKALSFALSAPVSLESDGRTDTIRLTTKSHPYAARNPDNSVVIVQSKVIRKQAVTYWLTLVNQHMFCINKKACQLYWHATQLFFVC